MLTKTKLNNIKHLISKALNNSFISHNEFVLVNNVLRRNQKFKDLNSSSKILIYYKTMLSYCLKCGEKTDWKNPKVTWTNQEKLMILPKCVVCDS